MHLIGVVLGAAAWVITASGVIYGGLLLAQGPHRTPPLPTRPVDDQSDTAGRSA